MRHKRSPNARIWRGTLRTVLDDFGPPARPVHTLGQPTAFRQRKIAAFGAVLRRHLDRLRPQDGQS